MAWSTERARDSGWVEVEEEARKNTTSDLILSLQAFVEQNDDPTHSLHYTSMSNIPDKAENAFRLLAQNQRHSADPSVLSLLVRSVKILSRKECNRTEHGSVLVPRLLDLIHCGCATDKPLHSEAASALLNLCYERTNVSVLLQYDGIERLADILLSAHDCTSRAAAAGAVQSVCYQREGRVAARDTGVIEGLVASLKSDSSLRVQARCAGALHNASSDPGSIKPIRRASGIPALVNLLSSDNASVCAPAAGALQNLSREPASRQAAKELQAAPYLTRLASSSDVHSQVCAAGALLNILGPTVESDGSDASSTKTHEGSSTATLRCGNAKGRSGPGTSESYLGAKKECDDTATSKSGEHDKRHALGRILSSLLTLSASYDAMFGENDDSGIAVSVCRSQRAESIGAHAQPTPRRASKSGNEATTYKMDAVTPSSLSVLRGKRRQAVTGS